MAGQEERMGKEWVREQQIQDQRITEEKESEEQHRRQRGTEATRRCRERQRELERAGREVIDKLKTENSSLEGKIAGCEQKFSLLREIVGAHVRWTSLSGRK